MAARVRARVFARVPARMSTRFLLHDDVRKVAEDAATNICSPIIYDSPRICCPVELCCCPANKFGKFQHERRREKNSTFRNFFSFFFLFFLFIYLRLSMIQAATLILISMLNLYAKFTFENLESYYPKTSILIFK